MSNLPPEAYGYTLESIGIGPDDLYINESGNLDLIPTPTCRHSDPAWVEDCPDCKWFEPSTEECGHKEQEGREASDE